MRNITVASFHLVQSSVLLLLYMGFSSPVALAGGDSGYTPPSPYYYCMSNPTSKTEYFSGLFLVPASTPYGSISNAFTQFIAGKYGNPGNVACFGDTDHNKAAKQMQQMSAQKAGYTVVATGWTYKAAPGAANADPNYNPHGNSQPLPGYNPHGNSPPLSTAHSQADQASASQPASAPKPPQASAIDGIYIGSYICAKGVTGLRLTLNAPEYGLLRGTFTFYLPPGSRTKAYTYSLNGSFDPKSGTFNLNPLKWETPAPPNYVMVGLKGAADTKSGRIEGIVDYTGCGRFEAMKGRED
ncbi:MAG TPA: hypothetical protein VH596_03660 [Terriglobales bacterium]